MSKDKSIIEKFTDTVKDIANSASEALKAEEPPKVRVNAAYMPFAAQGLVSDPLLIPPVVVQPRRKRIAKKGAKKMSARKATVRRSASRKTVKASAKRTTKAVTKRGSAKRSPSRGRR